MRDVSYGESLVSIRLVNPGLRCLELLSNYIQMKYFFNDQK